MSTYNISMLMNTSPSLGFLLHDVARQMRSRFDIRARALGVTRQQWRVLLTLAREGEGRSQAELADALDVERITLCRMIDRLADAGLVERRPDPGDRRVRRIHLLPPARAIVDRLTDLAAVLEEEGLALLSPADRTILLRSLYLLRDGLRPRGDGVSAERSAA